MTSSQNNEIDHKILDNAKQALNAANDAAGNARNLFIGFLALTAYIAVVIASTTHEQILRETPLTLPILNVELPLSGFYRYLPWLYLLIHFNLLLTLVLMAGKVRTLLDYRQELVSKGQWRPLVKRLIGFPVVQVLAGEQGMFIHLLLALMIWITLVLVPLGLMLWLLIGYLPAQDESVLAWQRLALTLDAAILLLLWPRLISGGGVAAWWIANLNSIAGFLIWLLLILWFDLGYCLFRRLQTGRWVSTPTLRRYTGRTFHYLVMMRHLLGRHSVMHQRGHTQPVRLDLSRLFHRLLRVRRHYAEAAVLFSSAILVIGIAWFAAVIPGGAWEKDLLAACKRNYSQPLAEDPCRWWPTWVLFDNTDAWFRRTLSVSKAVLTGAPMRPEHVAAFRDKNPEEIKQAIKSVVAIDLKERSLRYADLRDVLLPKADLTGARLQGANLRDAQLQRADLTTVYLQGAYLHGAQLQGGSVQDTCNK